MSDEAFRVGDKFYLGVGVGYEFDAAGDDKILISLVGEQDQTGSGLGADIFFSSGLALSALGKGLGELLGWECRLC